MAEDEMDYSEIVLLQSFPSLCLNPPEIFHPKV